ncbi:MAG: hypothetical protein HRU15_07680 [Planctomycetes bacterium]|nr:hypothetical protein [Planctomycetota bacterium]
MLSLDLFSVKNGPLGVFQADTLQCEIWTTHRDVEICQQKNGLRILSEAEITWPDVNYAQLDMQDLYALHQQLRDDAAYLILDSPQLPQWPEIAQAQWCRFVCCQNQQDFMLWDQELSRGVPIYGICGSIICVDCEPQASAVLQALAFGCYVCHHNLPPKCIEEGRSACSWEFDREITCNIIGHNGFQLEELSGHRIEWQDRGTEGYVRMHAYAAEDSSTAAWTQPRMIGLR